LEIPTHTAITAPTSCADSSGCRSDSGLPLNDSRDPGASIPLLCKRAPAGPGSLCFSVLQVQPACLDAVHEGEPLGLGVALGASSAVFRVADLDPLAHAADLDAAAVGPALGGLPPLRI